MSANNNKCTNLWNYHFKISKVPLLSTSNFDVIRFLFTYFTYKTSNVTLNQNKGEPIFLLKRFPISIKAIKSFITGTRYVRKTKINPSLNNISTLKHLPPTI